MNVFLLILIVVGKVLLIALLLAILLIIFVLFSPFRYFACAVVEDPVSHEEFTLEDLKENVAVSFRIAWLWKLLQVVIQYPGKTTIEVKIIGKTFDFRKFFAKKRTESSDQEEKEEEPEKSFWETLPEKIENGSAKADRAIRILTGSYGRRAGRKVAERVGALNAKILPERWEMTGTIGLGDPYRGGKLAGVLAMIGPFAGEHVILNVRMEVYQYDVTAEFCGKIRLFSLLRFGLPLFWDKDCRKVVRKLRRLRSMK